MNIQWTIPVTPIAGIVPGTKAIGPPLPRRGPVGACNHNRNCAAGGDVLITAAKTGGVVTAADAVAVGVDAGTAMIVCRRCHLDREIGIQDKTGVPLEKEAIG